MSQAASEISVSRSMTLYAVGALLGLGIAGFNLFTARGTVTNSVPPEDLALINQRPILRSDFFNQVESETGRNFSETSRQDRLKVLDEMVNEELRVQRALELDFAETDQDTRNALVAVVEQQIVADVATSEPTPEQLRDYYRAHSAQYATEGVMSVCNLLLPSTAGGATTAAAMLAAQAAVKELRANTPMESVLQRHGLINSNKCDEDLYFAARIHLGAQLYQLATALPSGASSDPISMADGVHVLRMIKNVVPVPMNFETAHDRVQSDFKMEREARITDATMKFLRHRSKILIADDYAGDYHP
jgi:hypothetical protein